MLNSDHILLISSATGWGIRLALFSQLQVLKIHGLISVVSHEIVFATYDTSNYHISQK